MSDGCASQYFTQIYKPQRIKQGGDLDEQFHTSPASFLDLFAELPVGIGTRRKPLLSDQQRWIGVYCDYLREAGAAEPHC